MNLKAITTYPLRMSVLMIGITSLPATSYGIDLMAVQGMWNPPDGGAGITMWGFAQDSGDCATAPLTWQVGPELTATPGNDLTVNLRNCLSEPVSIVIPGQTTDFLPTTIVDGQGRTRVTSFTHEAPANGGIASYTWTNVKSGSYLYQSGSHPAKQVQMGLYGPMKAGTHANTSGDVTLLYSEIDPALHSPPAAANPRNYKPKYFLVNGATDHSIISAGDTAQPTVVRLLNAGLDFHVPAIQGGHFMIAAEDGNAYPYPRQQYSAFLPAGKTLETLWQPDQNGFYPIFDRQLSNTVSYLGFGFPSNTAPLAVADFDSTQAGFGGTFNLIANDVDAENNLRAGFGTGDVAPEQITITSGATSMRGGAVNPALNGATYAPPAPSFRGVDRFTYQVTDNPDDNLLSAPQGLTSNEVEVWIKVR